MKILVLSDSHNNKIDLDLKKYDYVIHCGDYGVSKDCLDNYKALYVKGNCDSKGKTQVLKNIFGRNVLVTHGHEYNVKYGLNNLFYCAIEKEAKACFFGHTHLQQCFIENDILFINPGAYPHYYVEITEEEIILHKRNLISKIEFKW